MKAESSSMISAASLDKLSVPSGIQEREQLFAAFSGNYLFLVDIQTGDGDGIGRSSRIILSLDSFTEGQRKSCSLFACGH